MLAVITLGAVSAASDSTADNSAVGVTEGPDLAASDVEEISAGGDDIATSSNGGDVLSEGSITPNYTIEVTPDVMDAGKNYVAQYGQVITVNGTIENAVGNVSIRFGYSGNYHDYVVPLVDGKFTKDLTDYDRVRNNYQIQVSWPGDETYKSISWSKNIHVQMNNVTANGGYYGLAAYMDIDMFDATGTVTCIVNDEVNYTGKLENGKLFLEIKNYTVGRNYVDLIYSGDDQFNPIERSFTFNIEPNVRAPTIYNYEKAIVEVFFGEATGKATIALGNETHEMDIVDGKVTTEIKGYAIGDNELEITYSGDNTFNPFETTYVLTVLDKEDATIVSSVYKTATQNFIFINIPHATGSINVTVNGKKEVWDLENGTVKKDIAASDVITELTVSYAGNVRLNPTTSSKYVNLTDYIVNSETFFNYFNPADGRLYDFLDDGITLDFQGVVYVNPKSENEFDIVISKPINIISSTNDAYIDLNTTAGSLLGEHPGSSFIVGPEGSGSNISGIYLHNTELWISNTTNVVFDNISVVVEDQRVGSGVGATSVRDNSSYVTLKNSYFYTRNNGGSTTFTFSWANYCTFDNNTVKVEGTVGNLLYLNVYNIKNLPGPTRTSGGDVLPDYPLNNYNVFSNNRLYGKEGSAISVGIMVEGSHNVIANNTLNKTSISTSFGGTGANSNIYYGNVLMQGSGLTAQTYSVVYDNYVPGTLSTGTFSVAHDNSAGKMTVSADAVAYENIVEQTMTVQARATAYDNDVYGTMTVSGANAYAYENTVDAITVSGANAVAQDNVIAGLATVSGNNVLFTDNIIGMPLTYGALGAGESTGSLKVTGKNDIVFNNEIYGEVSITGTNTTFEENFVTDVVTVSSNGNTISDNVIFTESDYAIDLTSSSQNVVEYNRLIAGDAKGDEAVKSDAAADNDIERNMGMKIMTITVADTWYGYNNTIAISVPGATGNVTVKVNKKEYVEVPLVNGNVTIVVDADDIDEGLNDVIVTYNGDASIDADSDYATFMAYGDTVTPDTFFGYFTEEGFLKSTVPFDELSFRGNFENLVDYVIINKPLYIDGYKAKFINMGIIISSSNVTIEDLEMKANESFGNLITVEGENVQLLYLDINYIVGDEEACAIAVLSTENVVIRSCDISFVSNITSDDKETYAINIYDSENVLMRYNDITARLPGLYMTEYDLSYFAMGLAYVNPVRIYESKNVNFTSNDLDVGFSNIVATSYPDLQAMIVAGSDNVLIDGNDISVKDTFLKPGQSMGLVGIQFISNDNVILQDNEIAISTEAGVASGGGTAYPMTIIGTSIDIINNELVTEDNGPNIAIYMPMGFAAGKLVNIIDNTIEVIGNSSSTHGWALISGIEVQAGSANIYGNIITVYDKGEYNESNPVFGISTHQTGYPDIIDIQNNTIITNGSDTISITKGSEANITGNILYSYDSFGNDTIVSTVSGVVEHNMPPFDPVIIIKAGAWNGFDGMVTVIIPEATGNVTIKVGNKTFKDLVLVNNTVTQMVNASDLVPGANKVEVSYTGDLYHFAGEAVDNLEVVSGVITNETFYQYFDKNTNYLCDFIPDGVTLDFQGLFEGAQYSLYINKAVNVITSTTDAVFDSGANPNRNWIKFNVVAGGDYTNITGIKIINGDLFIQGASYVTVDDINMTCKMSGVGSGTGFLAIHSNAYYTTVKNSYFENGGTGSSCVVLGKGGKYAVFDNNHFEITGSSGNVLSSNVYVGSGELPQVVNYTNNVINSHVAGSAFMYGITVCGADNIIENNTLINFKGNAIINQYGATSTKNIYRNNIITGGGTMQIGTFSLVEDNYLEGAMTITQGCKAFNNTAKTMTVSGADAIVGGNTAGATTISGKNITFIFNEINGLLTVSSSGNRIKFNDIVSDSTYAIDLQNSANNTVTNNYLFTDELYGDEAVKFVEGKDNIVEDNIPVDPELEIGLEDIFVGEDANIIITFGYDVNGTVFTIVDAIIYEVEVINGIGQLNISDLPAGKYGVSAYYPGDKENYGSSVDYETLIVNKSVPVIFLDISDTVLGQDAIVTVNIPDATGYVAIIVDGDENEIELIDGSANYTIVAPDAGMHTVVVVYDGDYKFEGAYASDAFTLYDMATQFTNITIDNNVITAYLVDEYGVALQGAPVRYTINGVEFNTTTGDDGSVVITDAADSTVALTFDYHVPYLPSTVSINLKNIPPLRTSTELFADDFTQYSCDYAAGERGGYFKVQLKDTTGKPLANKTIAVGFNGVVGYYQTDADGWINKQIALQNAGEYTFASVFLGDDNYTASFIVNKITIVKKPTSISASSKSYKASASKKSYTATLKTIAGSSIDGKVYLSAGKKITFKVNGKTYTAKTSSNGKATVNLKLTKKGTYTIKVSFAGDGAYKSASASAKITIK